MAEGFDSRWIDVYENEGKLPSELPPFQVVAHMLMAARTYE